jgi:hypothetical protein
MVQTASSLLTPWSSFYIMTGSSAAALTGLMFVVITLITGVERARSRDGISMFSTPTVVHFGAALFISMTLSAPWRSLGQPATLLGLTGLFGLVYILRILYRSRRLPETAYTPDLEDWSFYTIFPLIAYGAVLAGAIALPVVPTGALFALAASVTLMIFIGIHNAWDIVTYLVTQVFKEPPSSS